MKTIMKPTLNAERDFKKVIEKKESLHAIVYVYRWFSIILMLFTLL